MNATLEFTDESVLGSVVAVDTGRVLIDAANHSLVTRVSVSNLVAIQGSTSTQFLIGIIERVTRSVAEELLLDQEDAEGLIPTEETQKDLVRAVLVGTYNTVYGAEHNVFRRGADSFPQIERLCYLIEASNLQLLMNALASGVPEDQQLVLGQYVADRSARAVANGNRFFQRHAAILGSTGSGKSWTVALLLERAAKLAHPSVIVLDMHGEYSCLTELEGAQGGHAQGFRIAGPGDLESPGDTVVFLPHWLLNRDEMLAMILDRSDQNAPNQAARFTSHVRSLKSESLESSKQSETLKTFTVDSPIPYEISALLDRLRSDDEEMVPDSRAEKKGDWNGKLTRFISRLEAKIEDRRYGFMFAPPAAASEYDWLVGQVQRFLASGSDSCGVKIVDFSEVPSDVLPVVIAVFARLLYDVQFWLHPSVRTPFAFICDEAHLYLPSRDSEDAILRRSVEAFERIAKEGRKYGVSLVVVSQRPSDVSHTILSQCNNFLALRLTNQEDQNVVKRLMPDSMAGLTDILPLLDIGEGLLLGDAVLLPTRIRLDQPLIKPNSSTRDFWTEWHTRRPDQAAVADAVEALRRQTRSRGTSTADG